MNAAKSFRPPAVSKMLALWTPPVLISIAPSHAATDMFLKIEGVKGESTVATHKEWIQIQSFSWGAANSGFSSGGGGAGKVSISELVLSKRLDKSSPALFLWTARGDHLGTVTFQVVRPSPKGGDVFYEVKLDGVIITSISTAGAVGDDSANEQISLQFLKIDVGYAVQGTDGQLQPMERVTWDVAANTGK